MNTNTPSPMPQQRLTRALRLFLVLLVSLVALSGPSASASSAGNCLDFDGTGDYADGSGISTSLTTLTLEAWVYHRTLPASVQRYVTVGDEVAVLRHDGASQQGQLHFYIKTGGSLRHIRVNNALQTGRWCHVAGTWDGTIMKLYLNGRLVGESTPGGTLNAPDGNVGISHINETLDGYLDDVRIWNDARTQTEINENMGKALSGAESGLEHYWKFDESSGSTAHDGAGSVDLTLHNMTDDDWVTSGAFLDFGDTPAPYPTLLADDGARHVATGPTLGTSRDTESNGQQTTGADGDDSDGTDDEDGVSGWTNVQVGQLGASVTVNVQGGAAKLDAWVDWNRDGSWGGPFEQIADHLTVNTGDNTILFDVPGWAKAGNAYARFRLSTAGGLGVTGLADDGEVEDYQVGLSSPAAGSRYFTAHDITTGASAAQSVFAADVDGDGDMDVLSASEHDDKIAWYENDGSSEIFATHIITTGANSARSVFAADVDGDGDMDVLSASAYDSKIAWYENGGSQNFTAHDIATSANDARSVFAADVDGDGDMDVLSASANDDKIAWYENDGSQSFTAHTITTGADYAQSVFAADVDSDGDMDVLSASAGDDKIAWYENDGSSEIFATHIITTGADYALSVFAADVDSDGDMDVLSASHGDDKIAWYENDGSQTFIAHDIITSANGAWSVFAADVDGDGDMDALSASEYDDKIAWYENDGSQTFTAHTITTGASVARSVFAADMDGDGDMDALSACAGAAKIAWYEQERTPVVTTADVTNITDTSADCGGTVTDDRGLAVTARGVCWNTTGNPTVADNHTTDGSGLGGFTSHLTGLTSGGQTYYVRAYATNSDGTSYGEQKVFATSMTPPGHALDFDGTNDYVQVADANNLDLTTNYTLEGWFKAAGFGGLRGLLSKYQAASANGYLLRLTDTDLDFDQLTTSGLNLQAGRWYHVAAVNSSGTRTLYLNGVAQTLTGTPLTVTANSDPLRLASDLNGRYFAGQMDEVRVWSVARTQTQIRENMHKVLNGDESNLVAYYRFDHLSGTALDDLTANDNDGTLNNMTDEDWVASGVPLSVDFGDTPAPYPVTLAENGARHAATGPTLGATRDSESDGSHSAAADADGADEDGVSGWTNVQVGQLGASVTVNVQGGAAKLDAWVDWNRDGSWGGPFEQIADHLTVNTGDNTILFDVPGWAKAGNAYARFRLSTAGDLGVTGLADDGEVEDYQVGLSSPASGSRYFTAHTIATSADDAASVFAADVDGDGDMDVLSASKWDDKIAWYENGGSQNFTAHDITTSADYARSVFAADVDGDGDMDVLSASYGDNKIAWYENDGSQTFTDHTITTGANSARSVFAADVDGDGDMDVLSASANDDKIAWYENDGSQSFTAHTIATGADYALSVFAADVDGDGDMDVLSASAQDNKIAWYENDGSQNFTAHDIATSANGAYSVFAADVDGDGDMDALSACAYDDKIAWYENGGSQSFTAHDIATGADFAQSVFATDVDGDGDMDVLSASEYDDKIAWYENDGSQNFTAHTITTSASGAYSVFAADVDGDGDMDVLSASVYDNKIAWYEQWRVPAVTTADVTNITATSADCGGTVTDDRGFAVTARGVCWNTTGNPTIADSHTTDGSGLGGFTSHLTGLTGGQTYYVRAYATNSAGTGYGEQKVFTTPMTPPGHALDFDGTNDYVRVADANNLDLTTNYTLEGWFKAGGFGGLRGLISKYQTDNANGYLLRLTDTDLDFDQLTTSGLNLQAGRWYHVAAVNSSGTRTLYLNGVAQTLTGTPLTVTANSDPLRLASDFNGRYFAGQMDEVRVWSVARTQAQIRDHMHKVLDGDEANLVAYYRFDHLSGTALDDLTANDNDGTLVNMANEDWVTSTVPVANGTMQSQNDVRAIWTGGSTTAGDAGLILANANASFLQDAGDDMVFGHNNLTGSTTNDLPTGGDWDAGNGQRWQRIWYLDKSDINSNGGTVDLTFDFSDGGMSGTPGGDPSNYRLLERSGDSGPFADITSASGAAVSISGDQVIFSGVNSTELGSYYTLGTVDKNNSPTAVELASFTATPHDGYVLVEWETASEIDNEGFNLWRSEGEASPYTRLNADLISARGGPTTGASYSYDDEAVTNGITYWYKLEDVDIHGVSTFHGPLSATPHQLHWLYLPLLLKGGHP